MKLATLKVVLWIDSYAYAYWSVGSAERDIPRTRLSRFDQGF